MMRIGDVARALDVTVPTVRYWSEEFPIPLTRQNGQRWYPQGSVNRLRLIKQLTRQEGYTLQGAKTQYAHLLSFR